MEYIVENDLAHFEFWCGARDRAKHLTLEELSEIEDKLIMSDIFGSTPTETQINDLFWYDFNMVCELIGLTEEQVCNRTYERS